MKKTKINIIPNGPIMIEGDVDLYNSSGELKETDKCFLCRCGGSKNKPYCDGSHKKNTF